MRASICRPNRLPLPQLLSDMLASGRWRQPTDDVIFAAVPFLRERVDFLLSETRMRFASEGQCQGFPQFREFRSSESGPRSLPWLDDDLALLIAVNREIGADIAVALDYRTSMIDPRVVASDWWSERGMCSWREVTPTFSAFVLKLAL